MSEVLRQRTPMSYSCIAFVHKRNVWSLFCSEVCSAILLDSYCHHLVSGTLTCSGQDVNYSVLSGDFDISNGHTTSAAVCSSKITHVSDSNILTPLEEYTMQIATPKTMFLLKMNAHLAGCVAKTLSLSPKFAHSFVNYAVHCARKRVAFPACNVSLNIDDPPALESCSHIPALLMHTDETIDNNIDVRHSVIVVMTTPRKLGIDYHWCYRLSDLLVKRMELDDAMNWLSTLGGAYSALGDCFVHHAKNAATISLKQLHIALEMGSRPVVIRCHLYFALSLLQTGRLRDAKRLILLQYSETQTLTVRDAQLVAMCRSLWNRLRYLHRTRRQLHTVKFVDKSDSQTSHC